MFLNVMSLKDLAEYETALGLIRRGSEILSLLPGNSEYEMSVDLTPGEPVTVICHYMSPALAPVLFDPPPPFLIEPADDPVGQAFPQPELDADSERRAGWGACNSVENVESPPGYEAAPSEAANTGESPEPAAAVGAVSGGGVGDCPATGTVPKAPVDLRTGPLDADERAEILRLTAEGMSRRDIAGVIGRKVQTVALFLTAQEYSKENMKIPAVQSAPVAKIAVSLPDQGPAADAAETPEGEAPSVGEGPDDGGRDDSPQRVDPQPDAPVTGGASGLPPAGASVQVQDLPPRQRYICAALNALGYRNGFDADLDLETVEGFARGAKAATLALDLALDSKVLVDRFRALTQCIRDDRGHMMIEDQTLLIKELRRRVAAKRARAA